MVFSGWVFPFFKLKYSWFTVIQVYQKMIHTYIYIYIYESIIYVCFFQILFHHKYYKILNIVPHAIQ